MSRLNKFREIRHIRYKWLFTIISVLTLIISGISITDYSINKLMNNRDGLAIITFVSDNNQLEISAMNNKFSINTKYLKRDVEKLKNAVKNIVGG